MPDVIRRLLTALLLAAAAPAFAADAGSRHLVSVPWLQQNLARPDVLLLDASPGPLHARRHIPGAVPADVMNFGVSEQSAAAMQERLRGWSLSPGRKVVIYDGDGMMWAARLFFELVQLGYPADDVALLDGGIVKWVASGGAVTQAATPKPAPGSFSASRPRDDMLARLPEFLAATGEPQRVAVVDALTPDYHFGARKFFDRGGHVPNALLLPRTDFFNADQTFKAPAELRRMLDHLGLAPERPVISYCGGGVAAAVPFFALKYLMGHRDVKLYRGSQLEWLRDERGLPVWSYSAPHLVRDADWVMNWGQGMLRQLSIARVLVVDVRPAAAFEQGHVPGAVHLPAAALRAAAGDAAATAALLQPLRAAVAAGHEIVVASAGGGINADSALALVLIESAQKARVSILGTAIDEWALRGLPLEKKAAPALAAANGRGAPKAAPTVAADAVTIASGATLPQRAGRVIHLPHASLLTREGQPLPAAALWTAIEKAGVPRYTDLVLAADDPGEAAVNYVLLKMMGFTALTVQLP